VSAIRPKSDTAARRFTTLRAARCLQMTDRCVSEAPKATFKDLALLPDELRAEIIDGVIIEKAGPTYEHGIAQRALGGFLGRRFHRSGRDQTGGHWPGGWWIGSEIDVEYEPHQVYCHDLVGWRRERAVAEPSGRPIRSRPDWVCEILSESNERNDRVNKFRVHQAARVPHYWLLDPAERVLVVHRFDSSGYRIVLTATTGEPVRAEPFADVEVRIDVMFGDEPDDE